MIKMKIEKHVCDVCGEVIQDAHPLRLAVQEYVATEKESWNGKIKTSKSYKNCSVYDICNKCATYMPKLLKNLRDNEI